MNKTLIAGTVCVALLAGCDKQPATDAASTESAAKTDAVALSQTLKSGIDLNNIDASVRPQDDFYRYVNGKWLDKTKIPDDKSSYGSFTALRDKSVEDVKNIIEETAKLDKVEAGSDAQKVRDLYRSFMNTDKLEATGKAPLAAEFAKIDAISNTDDLAVYFAEAQRIGADAPLGFWVNNDSKNPTSYIMYLTQSGLGLPDRDYYLKDDEKSVKLREQYVDHIGKMFALADIDDATKVAADVMNLETEIAKLHWSRKENRDRIKTYNKMELAKLSELNSTFNWQAYLQAAGVASEKETVVRQPSYFKNFAKLYTTTDLNSWKNYFKWQVVNAAANYLSSDFDKQNFAFYGTILNGTPKQEVRWKRAVSMVNRTLGEVVGKIYVSKHFKPEAKARMVQLVENLRSAYKVSIENLDWMSEETKKQALEKLAKFTPKIGYPDKWKDYSSLEIKSDDLIGNAKRAATFGYQRMIEKLGKPIDRTEWHMNPQTVNAYYNPVMNEIVFPAAILQPPFFNMEADDAVNYGGIGGVIGHEMGHGFDDQGAKSDGDGVLRNWWTEQDLAEFKKRTQKLADQYSAFEPLPGEHINGELTLGENIGDLGGLTISHKAYQMSLQGQEAPVIDGLSGEQRFFMGWAQVWAYKYRDEALRNRLKTDPHSPATFRGNGTVMNMPEFYKVYDIKAGDGMYRAPEERVKIW